MVGLAMPDVMAAMGMQLPPAQPGTSPLAEVTPGATTRRHDTADSDAVTAVHVAPLSRVTSTPPVPVTRLM